jgi:hypothetical protein
VKYIAFWEHCPEDFDKVIERRKQLREDVEKHPEKYTKTLFPSHTMGGEAKGFTIIEGTPEQLTSLALNWMPLIKLKFVPIIKSAKVIEQYQETKK